MNNLRLKRISRQVGYALVVVAGGLVVAMGIQRSPILMVGFLLFGLFAMTALYQAPRLPGIFLGALGVLLALYLFLGRGGAYVGVPPLFVGEVCLALGLAAFILSGGFKVIVRFPLVWLLLAFMVLGAFRTLPYIGQYGIVALRDAAIWGYAVFAILTATCLLRTGWINRALGAYGAVLPWFILWVPIAYFLDHVGGGLIPRLPVSRVPIMGFKPGDALVHLAGAGGFMLLGLYGGDRRRQRHVWFKEWILWSLWLIGFILTATSGRGGMLAATLALTTLLVLRPTGRWLKIALLSLVLLSSGLLFGASFNLGAKRDVSLEQLQRNVASIFTDEAAQGGLSSTREWRLEWWKEIVDYTFNGPYFFSGKGFGINLFVSDINPDATSADLRSPHNGHMTILARMGVPGFTLWVLIHGLFAFGLLRAYMKAKSRGQYSWAKLNVWILCYWIAFMVNGAFDVFLEGPQGGIWFWSVIGLGIAALHVQDRSLSVQRGGDVDPASMPPPVVAS